MMGGDGHKPVLNAEWDKVKVKYDIQMQLIWMYDTMTSFSIVIKILFGK